MYCLKQWLITIVILWLICNESKHIVKKQIAKLDSYYLWSEIVLLQDWRGNAILDVARAA